MGLDNMITIDSRIGSGELLPLFPKGSAKLGYLNFGDFMFIGKGKVDAPPVLVGIERKKTMDLLSSMVSGRLSSHQIPGLRNSYNIVYLLVEGIFRSHPRHHILEHYRNGGWTPIKLGARTFMAKEVMNYFNTLTHLCDIIVIRTQNKLESVCWILSTYSWWDKHIEEHTSHKTAYKPYIDLITKKPPLLQRVVSELGGIGFKRSNDVAKHFNSLIEMVLADSKEWQKINGIGKKLANAVVTELQGGS